MTEEQIDKIAETITAWIEPKLAIKALDEICCTAITDPASRVVLARLRKAIASFKKIDAVS